MKKNIKHINENNIRKIVSEVMENIVNGGENHTEPNPQELVADFLETVKKYGNLASYIEGDEYAAIQSDKYEYTICLTIDEYPTCYKVRDEVLWPVDNASPAEYETSGEVEFTLGEIYVYDVNTQDEVCPDLTEYLTPEQMKMVNDAFDFDPDEWAKDDEGFDYDDYYDRKYHEMRDDGLLEGVMKEGFEDGASFDELVKKLYGFGAELNIKKDMQDVSIHFIGSVIMEFAKRIAETVNKRSMGPEFSNEFNKRIQVNEDFLRNTIMESLKKLIK